MGFYGSLFTVFQSGPATWTDAHLQIQCTMPCTLKAGCTHTSNACDCHASQGLVRNIQPQTKPMSNQVWLIYMFMQAQRGKIFKGGGGTCGMMKSH